MSENNYFNQKKDTKEQVKYKEQEEQAKQQSKKYQSPTSTGQICNNCGYENELGAKFCAECGANLSSLLNCPNCGSKVYPDADICEACGEWLLKGKCYFCYADLTGDEKFCPICGNSTQGIICPTCGTHNIFDFCKKCNTPLTEAAQEELKKVSENPFFKQLENLSSEIDLLKEESINEEELKKEIEKAEKELAKEKQKYEEALKKEKEIQMMMRLEQLSNNTRSSTNSTKKEEVKNDIQEKPFMSEEHVKYIERAKQTLQNAEERMKERLNKERELQQELNKVSQLTFATAQEARRFFNATKPKLYPDKPKYWECNYVHYMHPGPHDCARPELGGRWVF